MLELIIYGIGFFVLTLLLPMELLNVIRISHNDIGYKMNNRMDLNHIN